MDQLHLSGGVLYQVRYACQERAFLPLAELARTGYATRIGRTPLLCASTYVRSRAPLNSAVSSIHRIDDVMGCEVSLRALTLVVRLLTMVTQWNMPGNYAYASALAEPRALR